MFGRVTIKARPLKFAYLVDPAQANQVREAIRISSSLWGGAYCPIIPLYRRMPASWKDSFRSPPAKDVILGYIEAFDPDFLVQLVAELPPFITATGRQVIGSQQIWQSLDESCELTPRYGIGIFELLKDVFEEHFKYKAKYPVRVVIPRLPGRMQLFWLSVFGGFPSKVTAILENQYSKPLEIETLDVTLDKLGELMGTDVLFPRRL